MKDAEDDTIANQDPLGKFVHVKYTANLNSSDNSFDKWAFRPMWWYGVPAGLTDVHDINYSRFEKYTDTGTPAPSTTGIRKDSDNVTKHYANSKDWKGISNFYITDPHELTSMNGLKTLLGIDGNKNNGYDNKGNTAGNWSDYYDATKGMQGMFVDWESAGQRYYQMTYVAELTDQAWKERNEHPLRFAAGVYRFAGNWHIATGQTHHAPKIADSLKVAYPSLTPVAKADALNDTEKTSVKDAIKTANKDTKHFNNLLEKIDVANDGTATLTFHDNTTIKMPGKLLVVEEKKDNVKFPPVYPAPMGVVNPQKLSTDDQKAIIAAFKKENEGKDFLKKVSTTDSDVYKFDNTKQTLTITYTDGSKITVPYSSLVYQGAKISDWAPYVVPDPIEVANPSSLTEQEKKQVTDAFDTANADLDVYTAAKKDSKTPVSFDSGFKNAIITWADGSTSTIPSWQFLKKKAEQAPTPKPPTPKPAEKKTFTVDVPTKIPSVKFDPFNATQKDITDNQTQLDALKTGLKKCAAKDAKDGKTAVTIKEVEYAIVDGKGVIKFHADNYEDAVYPMSVFFKQMANKQTPRETEHSPQGKTQYKYKVKPVQTVGDTPNIQEQVKALKEFIRSNYGKDLTNDNTITQTYSLVEGDTPVSGTEGMQHFVQNQHDGAGILTISIGNDGSLEVQGYEKGNNSPKTLFTVPTNELYVKSGSATDHTVSDLKDFAKKIRDAKKASGVTDNDFKRAGIDDTSDNAINGMNEKQLRELIRKLTDATKSVYKYNTNPYGVDNPTASPTDDDFQAAVKQFLKANYDDSKATEDNKIDKLIFNVPNTATLTGKGWTPKAGTSCLELKSDSATYGITTVSMNNDDSASADFKNGDTVLFTVSKDKLYKKKAESKPAPSAEDLEKLRKQAKELIDRNPKLTEEQKNSYKTRIDQAKDKQTILDILKEANTQGNNNHVNANDLKEKEKKEKEKREKEKREKEQQNKLAEDKTKAKNTLNTLTNLTDGESGDKKKLSDEIDNAQTPEEVKNIIEKAKAINDARGALKEGALPFLSHGKSDSNDDKALKELIGADITKKDETLTALENAIKDISSAQTSAIRTALDAATRKNGINEQAARQAANAKIAEFENKLEAAEKVLNDNTTIKDDDKTKATNAINDAKTAIGTAKTQVASATTPSGMLTQLTNVKTKFNTANSKVNDAVNNAQKENKKQNTNDPDAKAFEKEKNDAKGEIDKIPGLSKEEKDKYKDLIDHSTHKGDPEAIVNQAKKHKKIEAALKAIDNFEHLNNAQKEAFKRIIEDTDASDHKNADGTTSDDIDDALANAANTDNAMARLDELKKKADALKGTDKYTGNSVDPTKKAAFDKVLQSVDDLLNKEKGDAKGAPEVNDLYTDLLNKMRDLDSNAQSAGLKTDALADEIKSDKTYKPDTTSTPAKPGNSVYNTSSQAKKDAFDAALTAAEQALKTAEDTKKPGAKKMSAEEEATAQKAVDAALDKLIKARLALDGVDTTDLQKEIDKESATTSSDAYKYDSQEKQNNYNTALQEAKDLIEKLTGKKQAGTDDHLDTKENKQKALDKALAKLKAAEEALKGKKPIEPTPTPTPTPTPSVDKSHLQQGINGSGDVKKSDDYNNAPSDKKQAYDHALDHANEVNNDPNATQDQVNQAAEDLKKAENDLKPTPSPLPTPVPGGHKDSGFGVNDNAPTTVDKGELNIQVDSAEADSQPGNAGAGNNNAGNNNAGNANANAANANNNAANGANSAAVNAAVENSPAVKQADAQVAKAQAALDSALSEAKKVAADPNATQAQVDAAAQKLSAARKALASAKAHAAEVRASVRAQVLKSGVSKLSKTGSNVSVFGLFAAVAAAGAAFFVAKRRGVSRHSNN